MLYICIVSMLAPFPNEVSGVGHVELLEHLFTLRAVLD